MEKQELIDEVKRLAEDLKNTRNSAPTRLTPGRIQQLTSSLYRLTNERAPELGITILIPWNFDPATKQHDYELIVQ